MGKHYACGICNSDRGPLINGLLAAGRTPTWIEKEMRRLERPTKAETIRRHRHECLNDDVSNTAVLDAALTGKPLTNADFAEVVRREAHRLLAEGKLRISTGDGLQAQALIDRRAEKQADRTLTVEIARLLSGVHSNPDDIIIAEWHEVTGERDNADADGLSGLAPLSLVDTSS